MSKDEGVLTIVMDNGLFIMGRMAGNNKLNKPRVYNMIPNPKWKEGEPVEKKFLHQLGPLPTTPPYLNVGYTRSRYPVTVNVMNKNLIDLYASVTDFAVDPG